MIGTCSYFAIITDIRLSGTESTEGIQLLHAVREQQPDAKVIVATGIGNSDIERTLRELGASHYFEKPVKPAIILGLLTAMRLTVNKQNNDDIDFGSSLPASAIAELP